MPENPPAASRAWRPPVLLALLLVAAGLLAVDQRSADATPVVASYARDTAHRWSGYRIPTNGHADGGWIGGYQIGDTPRLRGHTDQTPEPTRLRSDAGRGRPRRVPRPLAARDRAGCVGAVQVRRL